MRMSLKQVITDSGVRAVFRFSPVLDNWVVALRKAELQGFEATAVRIGTKRVVVAIEREVARTRRWLPFSAVAICLLVFASYLLLQQPTKIQNQAVTRTCLPIQIGEDIVVTSTEVSVRDWSMSMKSTGTLGSLQQFEVVANCERQSWSGQIVVNEIGKHSRIKKLTPTKR